MKHNQRIGVVIVALFAVVAGLCLPVNAQQKPARGTFSVSPAILNVTLSPGKTYVHSIRVKNLLNSPLPMRAEIEPPLDIDGTGGLNSLATWATIDTHDMIIPAGVEKIIKLTISTPSKIPVGGYYGTLFLSPVLPRSVNASGQIVQARAGVVMLANVGVPDLSARANIIPPRISNNPNDPTTRLIEFGVKSQSLYHFSAKPTLVIKPLFGKVRTYRIPERYTLPGKTRAWQEQIDWPFKGPNFYSIDLRISVGNGKQISYRTTYQDYPVGKILIIIGAIIVFFMFKTKKKNFKKAWRSFTSNK